MTTLAIILVVISAAMHAGRNFFNKKALDKQAFLWWHEIFGLVFFFPVFAFVLIRDGIEFTPFYYIVLLSGVTHFLYCYFFTKSFDHGDLSHVYPIMRSSPALILVISIFIFNEHVSLQGIIGIVLVALGVYSINLRRISISGLIEPIRSIASDRATQFAVATLVLVTVYSLIHKKAVERIHPLIFTYLFLLASVPLFTCYLWSVKRKGEIRREWVVNKKAVLVTGFIGIYGYCLILVAFTLERASYVVGLRQLSIVFAVLLGGHLLKEKHQGIRLVSAMIIFLGAILIATAK